MNCVYRAFNAAGALIYIGSTSDLERRTIQHRSGTPWWSEVVKIETESHPDRESAYAAESAAILAEQPRYNIVWMMTPAERAKTYCKPLDVRVHPMGRKAVFLAAARDAGTTGSAAVNDFIDWYLGYSDAPPIRPLPVSST